MQSIKRILLTALFLLVAAASTARAQESVDGKWVGTVNGPEGPGEVALELKAEGESLTGTIGFFGMDPVPFTAGKISGSDSNHCCCSIIQNIAISRKLSECLQHIITVGRK